MLAYLNRRGHSGRPPAGPPVQPRPPVDLTTLVEYVDAKGDITQDCKAYYDTLLDMNALGLILSECTEDLISTGNPQKLTPPALLCNVKDRGLQILTGILKVPHQLLELPPESPFRTSPYIVALGEPTHDKDDFQPGDIPLMYAPFNPEVDLRQLKGPLADLTALPPVENKDCGIKPHSRRKADIHNFHPAIPLYGKANMAEFVERLYPADGAAFTLDGAAAMLKDRAQTITDPQAQTSYLRSGAGLVTRINQSSGDQIGTIELDTSHMDRATEEALKGWYTLALEALLDPSPERAKKYNDWTDERRALLGLPAREPDEQQQQIQLQQGQTSLLQQQNQSLLEQDGVPQLPNQSLLQRDQSQASLHQRQPNLGVHQLPIQNPGVHQLPTQNPGVHQLPTQNPGVHQLPTQGVHQLPHQFQAGLRQQQPYHRPSQQELPQGSGSSRSVRFAAADTVDEEEPVTANDRRARAFFVAGQEPPNTQFYPPPPAKVARTEPVGFDSLSDFKKRSIMSFARVKYASDLPHCLLELLEQTQEDQHGHFMSHQLVQWKKRQGLVWSGYGVPAKLLRWVIQGNITQKDTSKKWWTGSLVALMLGFRQHEIDRLNELDETERSSHLQLTVEATNLSKLRMKMPIIPQTTPEILNFLKRVQQVSSSWYSTDFQLGQFASKLLHSIQEHDMHQALLQDSQWARVMGPEIVQCALMIERQEGLHIVSRHDFEQLHYHGIRFFQYRNIDNLVEGCLQAAPNRVRTFYFEGLAPSHGPRAIQGNNLTGTTQGTPQNNTAPGSGNPANSRSPTANNTGTAVGQPITRLNDQFHPLIKAFWDNQPENLRRTPISRICSKVGTNTSGLLRLLGLPSQACGGYHLKGVCRRNCRNDHTQRQVQDDAASQVVDKLTTGMAAIALEA